MLWSRHGNLIFFWVGKNRSPPFLKGEERLVISACLQIFQRVLGQREHVVLIDVVLRVCALVGRAVGVLHGELAAAVTDAEQGALEVGVALLGLPHVHLAHPPYLAVPRAERIDAVGLRTLCVASLLLVADAGPERGQVEVQAVVVCLRGFVIPVPARALEGNELVWVWGKINNERLTKLTVNE